MGSVLVVTNEQDLAADLIVLELERRSVQVLRCNTERVHKWGIALEPGRGWHLRDPVGRELSSSEAAGVWWRRPEPPLVATDFSSQSQRAAFNDQWQALAEGLASVPGPRWMSRPSAIRSAEDKAHQLAVASRVGFRVPATVWTNDAARIRSIVDKRPTVVKSVTAAAWEDGDGAAFVFAHAVELSDIPAHDDDVAIAPVVLQGAIRPKRDVRVTVVGSRVLAAIAEELDTGEIDWRLSPNRNWHPIELDSGLVELCVRLIRDLGLLFGGIDLAFDSDGRAWFLEVNANGEWGWLDQIAGLPIVNAISDELTR